MNWIVDYFTSSIGRKIVMALSGLFLCLFLVIHLSGNLQLFILDEGKTFNKYAYDMAHNPLIKIASIITFIAIGLHALQGILLYLKNRAAKGQKYAVKTSANASFASRNMTFLGTILLIFIVVHLGDFWYEMKFGAPEMMEIDGQEVPNLYASVRVSFQQWWLVLLYVVSMGALAFHLYHGFQSAFQSLGFNHKKYTPLVKWVGIVIFAFLIPALFAAMPIYFFLAN